MTMDFNVVRFVLTFIQILFPRFDFMGVSQEFFQIMLNETDFSKEYRNAVKTKELFKGVYIYISINIYICIYL